MSGAEERRQNRLLCASLFTFFVSGATAQPLGSFIPFLRETYGFKYDFSGLLLSCQSIGYLISILLSGVIPYLIGRRASILCTSVWMAVAYLIFVGENGGTILLGLAFFMTGIARGGNTNFSNTMVSTLPSKKSAQGYNMLHGCYAAGALLSPLLLVFFVNLRPASGWRIMAALLLLLTCVQIAVYVGMALPSEAGKKGLRTADRSFLKNEQFWLASIMLFFYISTEYAILGWLVTYFQDTGILNPNHAQMISSLLWFVMFCGRMIGVRLTDRISSEKLLLADGVGILLFFLLMFLSRTTPLVIIGLVGLGFFMATVYPSVLTFGSESIRGNDLGYSVMILSGSFGGVLTPASVGLLAERAGLRMGMGLVAGLTALLLISILYSTSRWTWNEGFQSRLETKNKGGS